METNVKTRRVNISSAKTAGKIGSILQFIPVVNVFGIMLIAISLYRIRKATDKPEVFEYYAMGLLWGSLGTYLFNLWLAYSRFIPPSISTFIVFPAVLTASFICLIPSVINIKKAYCLLGDITGEHAFKKAGKFLITGIATLLLLIGIVFLIISNIMLAVGFFSLPDELEIKEGT